MEAEKSIEDVRAENRALRACLRALTRESPLCVMRTEVSVGEGGRVSMVLSVPHVSQEREERMCKMIGAAFGAAWEVAIEGMRGFRSEKDEAASE